MHTQDVGTQLPDDHSQQNRLVEPPIEAGSRVMLGGGGSLYGPRQDETYGDYRVGGGWGGGVSL